ncbi:MAG: Gldg family protein [Thermoguttaceae bacterium]|nr:Gldg family protein [Thermoguttaceae bacterium]
MFALFKRNFTAYFLNPTGYVFLCVFTLACSCAAFLPDEFVNSNLANLDQLSRHFPLILLVFIPSVTMGIWADERRFGTEELLLTSPLTSWRIVLGKFAAAVGIYAASLAFASLAAWLVLSFLGKPDPGLFLTTCIGYFFLGTTMISLGMLASFFTYQLTIAYLAGVLLNVPLVVLHWADALPFPPKVVDLLRAADIQTAFEPFSRGTVALSSLVYFASVTALGLWAANRLLKRRRVDHGSVLFWGHTLVRLVSFVILAAILTGVLRRCDLRSDWSAERLSTLSKETIEAIDSFQSQWPVTIEAYLSGEIPPEMLKTRTDLLSFLEEMKDRLGSRCFLSIRRVEPNTEAASQLEKRYDIRPKTIVCDQRGQARSVPVFMTVVFRSGPKTSVIPFMHRGLSTEYELLSSLLSVSDRPRKRIGVVMTDAALFGRSDAYGDRVSGPWPILEELSRRYSVSQIDCSEDVDRGSFDLLLAVQPSTLPPAAMTRFIDLVRRGTPTLIFEDPWPLFVADVLTGTTVPKRPGMPGFTTEKGDIRILWSLLGVLFGTDLVWRDYNPYPKLSGLSNEFVFVDDRPAVIGAGDEKGKEDKELASSFDTKEPAVASLEHLLFPFTGYIVPDRSSETLCRPWIQTVGGGTASVSDIVSLGIRSQARTRTSHPGIYTLAARITGKIPPMFQRPEEETPPELNTVLVADLDMMTGGFFALRETGTDADRGMALDFDNVTFLLNAVDRLIGDDGLIAIRSRRTRHRRLEALEDATGGIRQQASESLIAIQKEFEAECRAEETRMNERIAELVNRKDFAHRDNPGEAPELQSEMQSMQRRLNMLHDEKKKEYDRKAAETQRRLAETIRTIQGRYKLLAVLLPPILPLIIGIAVGIRRRINTVRTDRR